VYHSVWSSDICSGLEVSRRGPNPEKIELMKSFILEMRNYLKKIFLSLMVDPNGSSTRQSSLDALYEKEKDVL
jgi:hypothetical protein